MAHNTLIEGFASVRGGVTESKHLEGPHAYVTAGNGWDQERVTLWAQDGRKLAAALRRVAAEIELATFEPDWVCTVCGRVFHADQPAAADPGRDSGGGRCFDCSTPGR